MDETSTTVLGAEMSKAPVFCPWGFLNEEGIQNTGSAEPREQQQAEIDHGDGNKSNKETESLQKRMIPRQKMIWRQWPKWRKQFDSQGQVHDMRQQEGREKGRRPGTYRKPIARGIATDERIQKTSISLSSLLAACGSLGKLHKDLFGNAGLRKSYGIGSNRFFSIWKERNKVQFDGKKPKLGNRKVVCRLTDRESLVGCKEFALGMSLDLVAAEAQHASEMVQNSVTSLFTDDDALKDLCDHFLQADPNEDNDLNALGILASTGALVREVKKESTSVACSFMVVLFEQGLDFGLFMNIRERLV
ncbi:hypothetical protein IFM89_019107 [Coptis chinensis]|uniref:Uncharacterized protein n=1 Tax=Coptis chinensis TaxID=261450 RepID=A0A835HYT9_9MAGN|nr:hypothetical protein IFM89_019107 [Coptis chinensis]